MLDPAAARLCSDIYLRLKLSFLPGLGIEEFRALDAETRRHANAAGYAAFLRWQALNGLAKP